jgi:hypothetical protein
MIFAGSWSARSNGKASLGVTGGLLPVVFPAAIFAQDVKQGEA